MKRKTIRFLTGFLTLTTLLSFTACAGAQNSSVDDKEDTRKENNDENTDNKELNAVEAENALAVSTEGTVTSDSVSTELPATNSVNTDEETEVEYFVSVQENLGDGQFRCIISKPITFNSLDVENAQIGDVIVSDQGTEFKVVAAVIPDDSVTEDEFFAEYSNYSRITIEGYESLYQRSSAKYEPRDWYMDWACNEPSTEVILTISEDAEINLGAMIITEDQKVFTGKEFIDAGDHFTSEVNGVQLVGGYISGKAIIKNGVIVRLTAKWSG